MVRTMLAVALAAAYGTQADDRRDADFGTLVEHQLAARSEKLFGVEKPLTDSAPATTGAYRTLTQPAGDWFQAGFDDAAGAQGACEPLAEACSVPSSG